MFRPHVVCTMRASSENLIMHNQASTDRQKLTKLLNSSDLQLSYITNVDVGYGLLKVGSAPIPFSSRFPRNTQFYRLMSIKLGEM